HIPILKVRYKVRTGYKSHHRTPSNTGYLHTIKIYVHFECFLLYDDFETQNGCNHPHTHLYCLCRGERLIPSSDLIHVLLIQSIFSTLFSSTLYIYSFYTSTPSP